MTRLSEAWACIRDHGKDAQDWALGWKWWPYAVKAALCVLLGRWGSHRMTLPGDAGFHDDIGEVTYLSVYRTFSYEWGVGAEFSEIGVARGWRYWHVHLNESGYP